MEPRSTSPVDAPFEIGPRIAVGDLITAPITGELTEIDEDQLRRALGSDYRPDTHLCLDLAGVRYLTSTGIRVLVAISQAYRAHGGRVSILNPAPLPRQVLEISGLAEVFDLQAPHPPDAAGRP